MLDKKSIETTLKLFHFKYDKSLIPHVWRYEDKDLIPPYNCLLCGVFEDIEQVSFQTFSGVVNCTASPDTIGELKVLLIKCGENLMADCDLNSEVSGYNHFNFDTDEIKQMLIPLNIDCTENNVYVEPQPKTPFRYFEVKW